MALPSLTYGVFNRGQAKRKLCILNKDFGLSGPNLVRFWQGGAKLYVFLCFSWFTLIFLGIALGFFKYFLVFPLQLLVIFRKHPFIFQGFSCFFLVFSLCFGKLGRGGSKLYAFLWFSWFTLVSLVFALHFLGVPGGFTEN